MSFIWPGLLYLLLCVPLLILLYWRMQRRRRAFAAQFGNFGAVHNVIGRSPGLRRHIPSIIFLAGITVLIFSLARPQTTIGLPKVEGTVILTFDVSGSMSADDLKPTRMEAAKTAAREFVNNQPPSVLIGVVAFSDGGISVQPPTDNHDETLATIDRLVPRRGTSVGNGILVALNTIAVSAGDPPILKTINLSDSQTQMPQVQGWYPSAAIVLLTDGENNQSPDPVAVSDLAADLGVRVYSIGIGSPAGANITVEGFTVHSQLDEALLKNISDNTGGKYYNAGNAEDLSRIYGDLKPKFTIRMEEMELTSILAALGMLVFLMGGALSLFWFGHVP